MADYEKQALLDSRAHVDGRRDTTLKMLAPRRPAWLVWMLRLVAIFVLLKWPIDAIYNALDCSSKHEIRYAGERVAWTPCGNVAGRDLECSSIAVPLDHFNASNNAGGKHFTIPLVRMRGKNATHNLLLNPGGPGGSGAEFIHRRGAQLSEIVGEGIHLLSFDPRGINGSKPSASCYPDDDARRNIPKPEPPRNAITDSGELWAWAAGYARACTDTMGEYGPHINTPQTAADMNDILDALGQEDMYYWGFSYGTLLGQTYATLFPERSKRVIIDGVVNQFDWYGESGQDESMVDTDSVYAGFVDECVKAGPEACALASHAETKGQLSQKLISSVQKLRDDPLSVYINSTKYGIVDYTDVWYRGVFSSLYKPNLWQGLAHNLASLLSGNATGAFLDYGWEDYKDQTNMEEANHFVELNDDLAGPEHWPQDRASLLDAIAPVLNHSMFTESDLESLFLRATWTVPRRHSFVPSHHVKTAHPLLVLSSAHDPITPLASAKVANAVFEGSRLVKVDGYGHCSIAVPSVCLARHVRAFLFEGKLPDQNEHCEVDGNPYFGETEGTGSKTVRPLKHFDSPEERAIHLAQVQLARDLWFRPRL